MITIGIMGYGYWGPNLTRNFFENPNARVLSVCDTRSERHALIQSRYPSVKVTADPQELLSDPAIDAVAIATPVSTHFDLALKALQHGKHVLLEKPLTATAAESLRLIEEAAARKLVLMVDHTFIYTPAVRKIKELIDSGKLGSLYYYDSVRVNLGLFQSDVNVLWDLAVHDFAILDYLFPMQPSAVAATGLAHLPGKPENIAYVTLFYPQNFIAHLHVNWLAPVKIRRTLICGDQQMVVYDDLEPSEKIKIYDKGITVNDSPDGVYQMRIGYRSGDMWAPQISTTEALRTVVSHFIECIEQGKTPQTSGKSGLRVIQILEAASQSLAHGGQPVPLSLEE